MSRPIRAVLAVDDGLDADDLVALFGGDESLRLAQVVPASTTPRGCSPRRRPTCSSIAAQGYSDRALFLVDRAVKADPDRPVLVLSHGSPNGFVRRVFELGGEDILHAPAVAASRCGSPSRRHCARRKGGAAAQGSRPRAARSPCSGRRVVPGKTLTSTNLAVALAQRGMRTAIVDLDLQFGDVGLCMGLPPDLSMYDLALAGGTIDADKLDAYIVTHPSGARALLAPNRPDQAGSVTVSAAPGVYARAAVRITTTSWSTRLPASRPR